MFPTLCYVNDLKTQVTRELSFQRFVPFIATTPSHMEAKSLDKALQL